MYVKNPCKDCDKREIGCHSNCKEYLEFYSYKRWASEVQASAKNLNSYFIGRTMDDAEEFRK